MNTIQSGFISNNITRRTGHNMGKLIAATLLVLFSISASAAKNSILKPVLTLFAGESKVIDAPNTERISVGKSKMISSTLLKSGEVILIAEEVGETNMQFWFTDGHRETMTVVVVESNAWRELLEVKALLGDVPGLTVKTVGRRIVVDGNIQLRDLERVKMIKERYPNILVLAREISPFEQKMLYFDVRVTEVNRDVTEELGINWSKSFAGPTFNAQKAFNSSYNKGEIDPASAGVLVTAPLALATGDNYSFWGISSSITSMINLLEQNGAAITLSQPRLSARSGGKSSLTVGGEVPVVTSSVSGQSVTYKDYGIILNIEPTLDQYNNIIARASVSVSQLDLANAVEGQPAFKKRFTENDIKLKPGETLALSGLITREEQLSYNGLKWLGDIPILGRLFKSKSFNKGESELVILITPKVIEDLAMNENKKLVDRSTELLENFEERSKSLME